MIEIEITCNYPHEIADPGAIEELIHNFVSEASFQAAEISVIFVSDSYLQELHSRYLDDNTPTDIMTFDLGEDPVVGELYISVDRAIAQAKTYEVSVANEIARLIIHGMLHLQGMDDRTEDQQLAMRREEDRYLASCLPEGWEMAFRHNTLS